MTKNSDCGGNDVSGSGNTFDCRSKRPEAPALRGEDVPLSCLPAGQRFIRSNAIEVIVRFWCSQRLRAQLADRRSVQIKTKLTVVNRTKRRLDVQPERWYLLVEGSAARTRWNGKPGWQRPVHVEFQGRTATAIPANPLDALGEERCQQIELVSCDMAGWIEGPVAERLPNAVRCVDPFHVVQLATDALDEVRREVWNEARRAGHAQHARDLKGARFALWKNPDNLTSRQHAKLTEIEATNKPLFRGYVLKEHLRQIYQLPPARGIEMLDAWIRWAGHSRLEPFRKLARTIREQRAGIAAAIEHGLSNARVEAINTQIRLISRRAFGFHTPDALIALAMLSVADLCPPLPR